MAGLTCFGVKLARGHCPEGQALAHVQVVELKGAKNSSGVDGQSSGVPQVWFEARAPGHSKSL